MSCGFMVSLSIRTEPSQNSTLAVPEWALEMSDLPGRESPPAWLMWNVISLVFRSRGSSQLMPASAALGHHDRVREPVLDVARAARRGTIGNRVRTNQHGVTRLRASESTLGGTTVDPRHLLGQRLVVRAIPRLVESVLGV